MTVKSLLIIVTLVILINSVQNKLTLKQVVILNRHSLRTPLSKNLNQASPKVWPKWDDKPGFLTAKGARLAGYMGSYFAAWLKTEGVLPENCPSEDDLHVFSNTIERTMTSAKAFVEKGFPDCKVYIHNTALNEPNPVFNPIVHNSSATFRELAEEEMKGALNTVQLNQAYELLSQILDYENSRYCEIDKQCNLAEGIHHINISSGFRPRVTGPLKICSEVIDSFLMQNYEGFCNEDIAWNQLTDASMWETIIELYRAYYDVTYKTRLVARDISEPLIKYMSEIFLRDDNKPKVTLLVGHDANVYTVFQTLLVKPYTLQNQYELTPIGSAVVFQKWNDDESMENYFKLSYVYQSTDQLRDSKILNLESPPQITNLELENCKTDVNGFCSWDDFKTFLASL